MAVNAKWNDISFQISETDAVLIGKIKMSAECETEDKEGGGQKYVSKKSGKPVEFSITAILNACLGTDVYSWVMKLMDSAQRGDEDHFEICGRKMFPFKLMLTSAATEEIEIAPSGTWARTNVNLTFKQSTQEPILDRPTPPPSSAGDGGGHSEPKKESVNKNPPATTKPPVSVPKREPDTKYYQVDKDGNVGNGAIPNKPKPPVKAVTKTIAQAKKTPSPVAKPSGGGKKSIVQAAKK